MIKNSFIFLFSIVLICCSSNLFAQDTSNKENLKFDVKTKTYTEPYSGSIITIPDNWQINESDVEAKPGESKMVVFVAPYKAIGISFEVSDAYENAIDNPLLKLFVDRKKLDYNSMSEKLKKNLETHAEVSELILNGEKYLRAISKKRYKLSDIIQCEQDKEVNRISIIKIQNGYMYNFFAMTDINYEEYKDFEKIVANTVYSEHKQ